MNLNEALELAFKYQMTIFLDMEVGFCETDEFKVYFWDMNEMRDAILFALNKQYSKEIPELKTEFYLEKERNFYWPKR